MNTIKTFVKAAVLPFPFVSHPLWKAYYRFRPKDIAYQRAGGAIARADAFAQIFASNEWGSSESHSGGGSTLETTVTIRRKLPQILRQLKVQTFLDAPCGDFNWMKKVEWPHGRWPKGLSYMGGDIVPDLITSLTARYADKQHRFFKLDLVEDALPEADLWLCRHALFHLPNRDVVQIFEKFAASRIKYVLATDHPYCRHNHDVNAGGYRFLNLREPPFSLPEPILTIDDFDRLGPPCLLALWSRDQVRSGLRTAGSDSNRYNQ